VVYYPIFFNLTGRPVVVIGGGKVALRKARALVEAGARVKVVAPRREPGLEALPVEWVPRPFEPTDLDGAFLAYAATDSRAANARVAAEAKRRGIPVNVADCPEECDFIVPSRIRRGNVQIAVSTSGENPGQAVELRKKIERALEQGLGS
jgi:siroheme synthase-like protein